jgi:BlaI family transcriptional regulator, penicillinase repressor
MELTEETITRRLKIRLRLNQSDPVMAITRPCQPSPTVTRERGDAGRPLRLRLSRQAQTRAAAIDMEACAMRKVQMVTDRELEILKILWARSKASVREVQDDLNKTAGPVAYSTVQTLLNIMEDKKGLVRHVVEGRTFIYIPKKSSDRTIRELTKRFVDRVFDGALDRVMVALLDSKSPTPAEFDRLRAMIDEAQRLTETRGPLDEVAVDEA